MVSEKRTAISWLPASLLLKNSYRSSGRISLGILRSATVPYQITFFTPSSSSMFPASFSTSLSFISSMTTKEIAPVPNSSTRISCPFIVSISPGRYERISKLIRVLMKLTPAGISNANARIRIMIRYFTTPFPNLIISVHHSFFYSRRVYEKTQTIDICKICVLFS